MILIVEDDKSIREVLGLFLDMKHLAYVSVSTVAEAMECLKKEDPTAMLLDMLLGDGDARCVISAARVFRPKMKIIVISGMQPQWLHTLVSGEYTPDYLLHKPFTLDALGSTLDRCSGA